MVHRKQMINTMISSSFSLSSKIDESWDFRGSIIADENLSCSHRCFLGHGKSYLPVGLCLKVPRYFMTGDFQAPSWDVPQLSSTILDSSNGTSNTLW
jgi:hypothetical protein